MQGETIETALVTIDKPDVLMRRATDVAGVSREIVLKTAITIQGRKYVKVEGWQAIAVAHGCVASSRDVERLENGFRAIGDVRRLSDGVLLATAEGFLGDDEKTWQNRPEYAKRAMAQTRAISRVCRAAFAHVVVMMDAGLSTTPAEEVPDGGFDEKPAKARKTPPEGNIEPEADKTLTEPLPATGTAAPEPAGQKRERFLNMFRPAAQAAAEVFTERGLILAGETIEAIEDSKIARMTRANVTALLEEVRRLAGESQIPGAEVPEEPKFNLPNEPWREIIVPFGKDKGVKLGELEKKRLWWYFMCYEPKPWEDKNGKLRDPSFADTAFHKELCKYREQVAEKYDFQPPKE